MFKMAVNKKSYNETFYKEQIKSTKYSAEFVYKIIKEICPNFERGVSPFVCDIGCGAGVWLSVFKANGCKVLGIDGNPYPETLQIDKSEFIQHDLREPLEFDRKFDLAICLEVAEHLPADMADIIVNFLTQRSDYVLFSAAIPFQGGTEHINEQWQSYWAEKFEKLNFSACDCIRPRIWNVDGIEPYYKQNILLYVRNNEQNKNFIEKYHIKSNLNVIHPEYWEIINNSRSAKLLRCIRNNTFIYGLYKKIIGIKK